MADQLYLSLWFPNFRFEALPAALTCVLRQFALVSSNPNAGASPEAKRVSAATVYPINFTEPPTYQRIYVNDKRAEENADTSGSIIENAVAEATEHLHDDMAVEFEMRWNLWSPELGSIPHRRSPSDEEIDADLDADDDEDEASIKLDPLWKLRPATVRILGFGPHFDDAGFEQNGHIRVDFGLDTPWTFEDILEDDTLEANPLIEDDDLKALAQKRIQQNTEMLLAFTLSVEKNCNISSRLLWTESGEPLAEKLIARLQRLN